jgi:predicted TIM-barrel fold metal-dependent hydrolase
MKIIDTHQHLLYPDRFQYPWCKGIAALEGKAFRLDEYRAAAAGTGISESLFMEAAVEDSQVQAEAKFFLDLAGRPGMGIAGVIATARPEHKDFSTYLESILHPRLKGLRRIFHTEPDELSQSAHFAKNLRLLAPHQLTFDLCLLPRQLPLAAELLRRTPEVQFVLDHCGIPNIKENLLDPWREHIRSLSQFPNLACKVSGVVAYCDPQRVTTAAIRPFVEHAIECFGWDRVVFGGDWPVCNLTSNLGRWVEIAKEIVGAESRERQEKFFSKNAERIYRLK